MDRVRLGRALGVGTRQAAKNLMEIADAAMSPDPAPPSPLASSQAPPAPRTAAAPPPPAARAPVARTQTTIHSVAEGGRRFSESFFGRLSRLGGALWLEFTGVFFGIFALFAAQGIWRLRAALYPGATLETRQKLFLAVAVALIFGYFCVSSFVRARRRERGQHKRR